MTTLGPGRLLRFRSTLGRLSRLSANADQESITLRREIANLHRVAQHRRQNGLSECSEPTGSVARGAESKRRLCLATALGCSKPRSLDSHVRAANLKSAPATRHRRLLPSHGGPRRLLFVRAGRRQPRNSPRRRGCCPALILMIQPHAGPVAPALDFARRRSAMKAATPASTLHPAIQRTLLSRPRSSLASRAGTEASTLSTALSNAAA